MTDITQRLRAEYILDTSRVEAANAKLVSGFQRSEAAAQKLREEFDRIERAAVVPTGLDTSTAKAIAQIERDLAQPFVRPTGANSPEFLRETMGLQNRWAMRDIERIGGMADPMVDGLYQMEAAFDAVTKADREAERQASRSKTTWSGSVNSLARFGSRMGEVASGLGWFGGAVYGVVAAIEAISSAFSRSQETVDAYGKALEGLPEKLNEIENRTRDFWAKRMGLDKLPGWSEAEERRKEIEQLFGRGQTKLAPALDGQWQELQATREAIQNFVDDQQKRAREAGLRIDESGAISNPATGRRPTAGGGMGPSPGSSRADSVYLELMAGLGSFKTSEGVKVVGYQGALDLLKKIANAQEETGNQLRQLRMEQIQAARPFGYALAPEDVAARRTAFAVVNELAPKVRDIFSPTNILAVIKQQQQQAADAKALAKWLKDGKFEAPIDARGAKITVNTEVKTDDPSRFADVAIKSAFVAAAARPLSATLAFGGPMVGGAGSR